MAEVEKKKIDLEKKKNNTMEKNKNNLKLISNNNTIKEEKMEQITINKKQKIKDILGIKMKQYIPYITIEEDGKIKKKVLSENIVKLRGITSREEAEKKAIELLGEEGKILSCYDLKKTNYGVIDNDDPNKDIETLWKEMVEKYPFLKKTYCFEGNTKGIRFVVEIDPNNIDPYWKGSHSKIMKEYEGDWCRDQWWNKPMRKNYKGKKIIKITNKELEEIFNKGEQTENIITEIPDEVENISTSTNSSSDILEMEDEIIDSDDLQEIKEHIKNIDKAYFKHIDNYKLIYASYRQDNKLKNIIKKLIQPYATNEPRPYNDWFEYLYKRGKNYEKLTEQLFKNYSYKSNKLNYFVITNKYYKKGFINCENFSQLSKEFIDCNKDNLIIHNKQDERDIYVYNEKFRSWKIDTEKGGGKCYAIKGMIDEYIEAYYESWIFAYTTQLNEIKDKKPFANEDEKLALEESEKEIKADFKIAVKAKIKAQGNTITNGILDRVLRDLFNNYNDNHIEFDERIELLPFQNGKCIDLFTFETKNIIKEDYIITKLEYNWIPPEKEDMKQFDEILNTIIDEQDVLNDLLYMFSCALFGHRVEYFFILNGGGRNGKSLLIDIFKQATKGIYYYASASTLEKGIDGGKPDPAIAGINNKRAIIFGEGNSNVKVSQATIKAFVGDSVINCRGCYSNRTEQRNIGTYIIPTNEKPTIDGKLDGETIVNKIRDIMFKNTFTNDNSKLHLPRHYPQNPRFKKPEFINKMKFCFIQKCVNFIKKVKEQYGEDIIYVNWNWSEQVRNDSKAYIEDCDILLSTIKENYDITNDQSDKVATEDIYNRFIANNNDIVRNPKIYPQYKGLSFKGFKEYVKKHNDLKYQFETKPTTIDGRTYRNVLKCLKLKEHIDKIECEIEDED
jgi:hypothetical protein